MTTDSRSMKALALKSGLEDGAYDKFVVAYGYYVGEDLIGCAGLKIRDTTFTVECLAIAEEFRRKGLGRALVALLEREAKNRGAHEIWAVARSPEFFETIGYTKMDSQDSCGPSLEGCMSCQQYQRTCKPAVVMKRLSQ